MDNSADTPAIKSFRDLIVWQKSVSLAEAIYQSTVDFPKSEAFGLTSQLRRSAVSVPSNIAEGHERNTELLSKVVDEDFSGGGLGFDSVGEFETLNYVG